MKWVLLVFPLYRSKSQGKERLIFSRLFSSEVDLKPGALASKSVLWTTKVRPCSCHFLWSCSWASIQPTKHKYPGCRQPLSQSFRVLPTVDSPYCIPPVLVRQFFQSCPFAQNSVFPRHHELWTSLDNHCQRRGCHCVSLACSGGWIYFQVVTPFAPCVYLAVSKPLALPVNYKPQCANK